VFRWRWRDDWRKNENARWAGKVAGNINRRGYVRIGINGRSYLAHRLAWFFIYGEWPQKDLDHIDGDPGNNHIANLRLATRQENTRNRQKNKNNTAGVPGVSWCKRTGKFLVQIKVDGKSIFLGRIPTLTEASAARAAAEIKYFGDFRRSPCNQNSGVL
jgi:hypothetical protein